MGNDPQIERYDPDLWIDEFRYRFCRSPGEEFFNNNYQEQQLSKTFFHTWTDDE